MIELTAKQYYKRAWSLARAVYKISGRREWAVMLKIDHAAAKSLKDRETTTDCYSRGVTFHKSLYDGRIYQYGGLNASKDIIPF